ncbi:MAG: PsiF family protein [Ramlibacter sp.]
MNKLITVIVLGTSLAFGNAFAVSADPAPAKPKTKQQIKMASCNKDAKEKTLKGAERKKFMSSCLKAQA